MTIDEAIKNREECLKYLEGIGKSACPECVEAVRLSVKALKAMKSENFGESNTIADHFREPTKMVPMELEQLQEMDGQPAYWMDDDSWGIISVDSVGMFAGIPFFMGRKQKVNFTYDIAKRGIELYAYPPYHIDRETWEPCLFCCEKTKGRKTLAFDSAGDAVTIEIDGTKAAIESDSMGFIVKFCPECGRLLTDEAWNELEKRLRW